MSKFVYDGILDTMYGHARRRGILTVTIDSRIRRYGNTPENRDKILHVGRLGPRMMTYAGITDTTEGWARRLKTTPLHIVRNFPDRVMTDERMAKFCKRKRYTVKRPGKPQRTITYRGETHGLSEWARITGHTKACILKRLKKGLPLRKVFARRNLRWEGHSPQRVPHARLQSLRGSFRTLGIIV